MIAIVNTDPQWGIGRNGQLQVYLKEDLKRFKELTTGKVIIYGSKTLTTFPRRQPLPNRRNIVLTRRKNLLIDQAELCHSRDQLLARIDQLKREEGYCADDFFVIGGASIYNLLLSDCDTCLVTRTERIYPADAHFPNLDQLAEWQLVEQSKLLYDEKEEVSFRYLTYRKHEGSSQILT